MSAPKDRWLTLDEARAEITGHRCNNSLDKWIQRYDAKNPQTPVSRRHGRVEEHSLRRAFGENRVSKALTALHLKDNRPRKSAKVLQVGVGKRA